MFIYVGNKCEFELTLPDPKGLTFNMNTAFQPNLELPLMLINRKKEKYARRHV